MSHSPAKPWFAAKRYGYGSGLPIAWQGWAVFLAYILTCTGAALILPFVFHDQTMPLAPLAIICVATVILMIVVARKTKGGWRWRWGKDD